MWIANTTRQEFQLEVRLPEMGRIYVAKVSSGKQVEIKDLSPAQEDYLIAHMERFGGVKRQNLHGKLKEFQGIAFATDKAFKMEEFHYGFEEVMETAQNRSVEEAVKSAMAADMHMREANGDRKSQTTEIEMAEEKPANEKKARRMKITVDPKVSNQTIQLQ